MKTLIDVLILLFLLILESALSPLLNISGIMPNLVLLFALSLVVLESYQEKWKIILLAGLLVDLLTSLPFGFVSLSLVLSSYLVDWFKQKIFSAIKFWIIIILISLGILFYNLFLIILAKLFQIELRWDFAYFAGLLIYNLVTAIIIYYGIKSIKKIFCQKK
jgi:rod shape-determining protein MreD